MTNESALRQAREALFDLLGMLRAEAPGTPLNNHRFDALGIKANAALAAADAALTAQAAPSEPVSPFPSRLCHYNGGTCTRRGCAHTCQAAQLCDERAAPPPPAAPAQGPTECPYEECHNGACKYESIGQGYACPLRAIKRTTTRAATTTAEPSQEVLDALGLDAESFYTEGGSLNVNKLRAAIKHPADYLPADHWLNASAQPSDQNTRRLTGLIWRFGRDVLPTGNVSFDAWLFQLDGFIDGKTEPPTAQAQQAQGLTPERIRLAVEALPNKPLVYRDFEHGALWAARELRTSTAAPLADEREAFEAWCDKNCVHASDEGLMIWRAARELPASTAAVPSPVPADTLSNDDVGYPRDVFSELISRNSPYAFYLFQWVPYQTDARRWRLKLCHDVRTFDGREAHCIWPNGSHCGPFNDSEVEFIRISRKQHGEEWVDPRPSAMFAAAAPGAPTPAPKGTT
jgi:hypothetical protein